VAKSQDHPLRLLLGATDKVTSPGHGDVRIGLVRTSERGTPRRLRPWAVGNRRQEIQQLPSRGAVQDGRREIITRVQHQVGVPFAQPPRVPGLCWDSGVVHQFVEEIVQVGAPAPVNQVADGAALLLQGFS
jgi:hypothetical protein